MPVDISALTQIEIREQKFSGPIPPPQVLAAYDGILPGLGADIVQMAKDEQSHRHRIVETAIDANIASDKRGQWMAATIAVLGLIVALILGVTGNPLAGVIITALDLGTVVGLFLKVRHDERKPEAAE